MHKLFVFLCLWIGLGFTSWANPVSPNMLPIEIQSDTALWDQKSKQAVHKGNVVMKQGDRILHAETLTIEKNDHGEINRMTAKGHPATFEGSHIDSPTPLLGRADIIFFYPATDKLLLKGEAVLTQGLNTFKGPEVAFDFVSKQISAQASEKLRPTLIYQPQSP